MLLPKEIPCCIESKTLKEWLSIKCMSKNFKILRIQKYRDLETSVLREW